jgi:hypothetical protein
MNKWRVYTPSEIEEHLKTYEGGSRRSAFLDLNKSTESITGINPYKRPRKPEIQYGPKRKRGKGKFHK